MQGPSTRVVRRGGEAPALWKIESDGLSAAGVGSLFAHETTSRLERLGATHTAKEKASSASLLEPDHTGMDAFLDFATAARGGGAAAITSAVGACVSAANASSSAMRAALAGSVGSERWLYINQAGSPALSPRMLEFDTMVLGACLLTTAHALLNRRSSWPAILLVVAALAEQGLIRLAGSHCHSEGLVMVSQCSSLASVGFYVPVMYASSVLADRLALHPLARPWAAAVLTALGGAPFLLLGGTQGWWRLAVPNFEVSGGRLAGGI